MKNITTIPVIIVLTFLLIQPTKEQTYALDYTEYIRFEQRALLVFEGRLQPTDFESKLQVTIKENEKIFTDYEIKHIKLLFSGYTIEIQFEFKKDIEDGIIEIAILDATVFTRDNSAQFGATIISLNNVYELADNRFKNERSWEGLETFTKVAYIISILLFIFGFYDEFLSIMLLYQRYHYLILINHKSPPLFEFFLQKLQAPWNYESNFFNVSEQDVKCQNQKKFNAYSCAFFNNHGTLFYRFLGLLALKIVIKLIDYILLQRRLNKAKKQIEEERNKNSMGLVRNLAFQRSATIVMKEYIKEQKKAKGTNCIAIVNHYISHNFFFYFIRYHTLPVFMSLWLCMYRYREDSSAMRYNFIVSIALVWIFIIYTAYVLYQYMNYFPKKKKKKEPLIYRLSFSKDNTFKRKGVVVGFLFDMIRALVFVFFIHLPDFVLPIFIAVGILEIAITIQNKRTNILYRIWKVISRFWFCLNLSLLYYYHIFDFYGNQLATFLISSVFSQIVLTLLISIVLGLLGLIGFIKYFQRNVSKSKDQKPKMSHSKVVPQATAQPDSENKKEVKFQNLDEDDKKIDIVEKNP